MSTKDMRRADLIVPYTEPEKEKSDNDISSTLASTLPMMAMFTRNKMLGWVSLVFAIQTWLAETPESRKSAQAPGYFSVLLSTMGLGTAYLQLFLPPPGSKNASGTEAAQPPAPPA